MASLHLLKGLLHDALRPLLAEVQRLGRVAYVSCMDQHAQRQSTLVVRPVPKVCWQQLAGRDKVLHKEQFVESVSYLACTSDHGQLQGSKREGSCKFVWQQLTGRTKVLPVLSVVSIQGHAGRH